MKSTLRLFSPSDGNKLTTDWDLENPPVFSPKGSVDDHIVVVFDTNVLLKLYDLMPGDFAEFTDLLQTLQDGNYLFIPDEVVREFWKNRPGRIATAQAEYEAVISRLSGARGQLRSALDAWAALHMSLDSEESESETALDNLEGHTATSKRLFDSIDSLMEKATKAKSDLPASLPTTRDSDVVVPQDKVVEALSHAFDGVVGAPPTQQDRARLYAEAVEAGRLNRAPGRTDLASLSPGELGDFLIWKQMLDYAEADPRQDLKMILVTRERKLDWWRTTNPKADETEPKRKSAADSNSKNSPGEKDQAAKGAEEKQDSKKNGAEKRRHLVGAHRHLIEDYLDVKPGGMIYVWEPQDLFDAFQKG